MRLAHAARCHGKLKRTVLLTVFATCVPFLVIVSRSLGGDLPVESTVFQQSEQSRGRESKTRNILVWNSPGRIETAAFGVGSTELFAQRGCRITQCQLFHNHSELPFNLYDAVLFNIHTLHESVLPAELGLQRGGHQRFVLLTQESPDTMRFFAPTKFNGFFNWTMSYKLNSDVQLLYGRVRPKRGHLVSRHSRLPSVPKKSKTAVWMASHCQTPGSRESYVAELRQYIDVAIYGSCGDLSCPRNDEHWLSEPQCYNLLSKTYKFYLSFENSVCQDYVTEKFFNVLGYDMVPVVYGGANYSAIAPPHSYIDALKYTPRQLAEYLIRLESDQDLYLEYFAWKRAYVVEAGVQQMARHGFCDLCAKLHEEPNTKVYSDLQSEWGSETQCRRTTPWEVDDCYGN